ncbi:MAG: hypothetical protein HY873_11160 [Chloroflexi bacterium]|nr:hypothetical protein [Chloroflexota bacterium]
MPRRFEFRNAYWFRAPLRLIVVAVTVFALMSLYPALSDAANPDHGRAILGIGVLGAFILLAAFFMVAMNDGCVEIGDEYVTVQFESFFEVQVPLRDIVSVTIVEPRPRFRYLWGLSTNFRDRVACSHGGQLVQLELGHPCRTRLWPRTLYVTRFWLGVRDPRGFAAAVARAAGLMPEAGTRKPDDSGRAYAA